MPNLKNLITALIAPLSARPKSQFYQTITPVSGQTASYTMPVDDWVHLYGANPTGSNQVVQLWGDEKRATLSTSTTVQAPATWSSSAIGFYRKGDLIFYSISGFSEMTLNIFALVGGGYLSSLVKFGGGLWLRLNHSFKCCSSYPAGKQCQGLRLFNLLSKSIQIQHGITLLPKTVTSQFRVLRLSCGFLDEYKSTETFPTNSARHRLTGIIRALHLRVKKDRQFKSPLVHQIVRAIQKKSISDLLKPSAHLSFCEGGAL